MRHRAVYTGVKYVCTEALPSRRNVFGGHYSRGQSRCRDRHRVRT